MSDELAAPDDPETQDTSEIPEETELPENEEADIPQEMLPDDQEDQPEAAFEENAASEDMETETDPAEEKSGFCGAEENTVSWSLDENGVLEIAGQGAMNEWQNEEEVPWNGYRDQITEVRIKEGVTSIGAYAFADCENLVKLDMSGAFEISDLFSGSASEISAAFIVGTSFISVPVIDSADGSVTVSDTASADSFALNVSAAKTLSIHIPQVSILTAVIPASIFLFILISMPLLSDPYCFYLAPGRIIFLCS